MTRVLLLSLLSLFMILTAVAKAQTPIEVLLNQKEIHVSGESALLIRTHQTPDKVKIKMAVPMKDTVCLQHGSRLVTRRDELRCGSHLEQRTSNCSRVCVRSTTCAANQPNCRPRCLTYETRCSVQQVRVVNICTFSETFCAQSGVRITGTKTDQVTIKFKDLPALREGETESFSLAAHQARINGSNVEFSLQNENTIQQYLIKVRDFLGDVITVKSR